ncbi:MAG TPA: F0F1 ATP synthase subunit gamma [Candidatus Saccharimonadales bacterium]|nr:F0F1 ATP synthase subunit gamma [Candidatus Saccharimonadales bacterium]
MRRPLEVAQERDAMGVIVNLTEAFEGLASMRISQIKNQVLESQRFFEALWGIYNQLRIDPIFRFGRTAEEAEEAKELLIGITAEGGFSGDIDQQLISFMLKGYDPEKQDIIIIGHHGAVQLAQAGVGFKKYFKLPSKEQNINVAPLVEQIRRYRSASVYYQTYVSLMVQDVKRIELSKAVQEAGRKSAKSEEVISEDTYIFEPSSYDVIAHLERSMLYITMSQLILDSKLAQYASRFRAMNVANERADSSFKELRLLYNRSRRSEADERLKEILNGQKKARSV